MVIALGQPILSLQNQVTLCSSNTGGRVALWVCVVSCLLALPDTLVLGSPSTALKASAASS